MKQSYVAKVQELGTLQTYVLPCDCMSMQDHHFEFTVDVAEVNDDRSWFYLFIADHWDPPKWFHFSWYRISEALKVKNKWGRLKYWDDTRIGALWKVLTGKTIWTSEVLLDRQATEALRDFLTEKINEYDEHVRSNGGTN